MVPLDANGAKDYGSIANGKLRLLCIRRGCKTAGKLKTGMVQALQAQDAANGLPIHDYGPNGPQSLKPGPPKGYFPLKPIATINTNAKIAARKVLLCKVPPAKEECPDSVKIPQDTLHYAPVKHMLLPQKNTVITIHHQTVRQVTRLTRLGVCPRFTDTEDPLNGLVAIADSFNHLQSDGHNLPLIGHELRKLMFSQKSQLLDGRYGVPTPIMEDLLNSVVASLTDKDQETQDEVRQSLCAWTCTSPAQLGIFVKIICRMTQEVFSLGILYGTIKHAGTIIQRLVLVTDSSALDSPLLVIYTGGRLGADAHHYQGIGPPNTVSGPLVAQEWISSLQQDLDLLTDQEIEKNTPQSAQTITNNIVIPGLPVPKSRNEKRAEARKALETAYLLPIPCGKAAAPEAPLLCRRYHLCFECKALKEKQAALSIIFTEADQCCQNCRAFADSQINFRRSIHHQKKCDRNEPCNWCI